MVVLVSVVVSVISISLSVQTEQPVSSSALSAMLLSDSIFLFIKLITEVLIKVK